MVCGFEAFCISCVGTVLSKYIRAKRRGPEDAPAHLTEIHDPIGRDSLPLANRSSSYMAARMVGFEFPSDSCRAAEGFNDGFNVHDVTC